MESEVSLLHSYLVNSVYDLSVPPSLTNYVDSTWLHNSTFNGTSSGRHRAYGESMRVSLKPSNCYM
jgi:FMN-dependent NADH-azoreductase